jgi:hypothetical protein
MWVFTHFTLLDEPDHSREEAGGVALLEAKPFSTARFAAGSSEFVTLE